MYGYDGIGGAMNSVELYRVIYRCDFLVTPRGDCLRAPSATNSKKMQIYQTCVCMGISVLKIGSGHGHGHVRGCVRECVCAACKCGGFAREHIGRGAMCMHLQVC